MPHTVGSKACGNTWSSSGKSNIYEVARLNSRNRQKYFISVKAVFPPPAPIPFCRHEMHSVPCTELY